MKKVLLSIIISVFSVAVRAQGKSDLDWRKASPEKRKELIKNMSPDERKNLLKQFRENILVEDLKVPIEDQEAFKQVYTDYQESQKQIKDQFKNDFDADKLSDDEAKQKLEESFNIGQRLLDNRRAFARKMQQVVKPQQVLKMFQNEGQMRDKMLDRRMMEARGENSARTPGGFRNSAQPEMMRNNHMSSARSIDAKSEGSGRRSGNNAPNRP